jgi:hypothetical protein
VLRPRRGQARRRPAVDAAPRPTALRLGKAPKPRRDGAPFCVRLALLPRLRFDRWDRGSIHAAEVAALDLDDAGGAGARGDQLSRRTVYRDQASDRAVELGLKGDREHGKDARLHG